MKQGTPSPKTVKPGLGFRVYRVYRAYRVYRVYRVYRAFRV